MQLKIRIKVIKLNNASTLIINPKEFKHGDQKTGN